MKSIELAVSRSAVAVLLLIQALSVSAAGLQPTTKWTSTCVQDSPAPTEPGLHALGQSERTLLEQKLEAAAEKPMKVNASSEPGSSPAPISISDARFNAVQRSFSDDGDYVIRAPEFSGENDYAIKATLTLRNDTAERLEGFGLRFTSSLGDTEFFINSRLQIEPHAEFTYEIPLMLVTGEPSNLQIEIVGVKSRRGIWGSFPAHTGSTLQSATQPASIESRQAAEDHSTSTVVDEMPHALNRPRPNYTEEARNNHISGSSGLRLLIGSDGSVRSVKALTWLPDGLTMQSILTASQMKFTPALKDGNPVNYAVTIEVEYDLW